MIKKVIPILSGSTGNTNTFNFKVGLTTRAKDWGWLDSVGPSTPVVASTGHTVTGTSSSRLDELRKYTVTGTIADMYFTSTSSANDGVNVSLTITGITASTYVYYIGGITYKDVLIGNGTTTTTTFLYVSQGLNDPANFVNERVIKLESKQNMVEKPFINSDVFIIRQEIPVFEQSVRLRGINSLNDIIAYAGGNYFKIYDNI